MEELGEMVTRRQKLSMTDEVELSEEVWLEELEETPSDPGELEDLICDPMEVPPTISHHFSILHVLDLSYTEIKSLPQSISRLVALQKLFLRSCEHLMELPPEIGELTNLEVLDLEGTEILCLPKEIAKLVNLTCLKVSFYGYASQTVQKVIPRRVLSNLSRLIELIIDVSPYGEWWDVEVEAIIDDLRSLKQLETLKLYLPTTILLEELKCMFPGLPNFRFTVGRHEEHFISRLPHDVEEEFNNLEKGLKYMNGSHIPNEITKVFKPNAFFLQRHWTAKSLSDFGHENINEVKFCLVMECNEFRTIIDSEQFYQGKDAIVLGSLERLIIRYLKNVESIWKGPVGKGSLSNLKSLVVFTCPNLTTLLTIDMLGNLSNLEELIVEDCPKIESVVSLKSSGSKSDLFLPSLKKISLIDVPELVSISGGLWIAPKLERLVILYCPKLEKLCTTEVSSTELKVIKGEKDWWDALKWYESDLSTEHGDYLARLFIPLRRDGDLMAQLTEDEISGYGQGKVGSFNIRGSVKDQYLRSSMASSSNPEFEVIYDIFLSFRGLDTHHKFIDHLYKALKQEGFETFRDDDEIERGEDIISELHKAILNSRLSVIVLSKNYANSTVCLFEIQTILEHRKKSDHLILPVFYEVDPLEIKEQARNLDFRKKKVTAEEVEGWSAALKEVASMAGMVSQNQSGRYDAKFIEEIVGEVKIRLAGKRMRVADHQEFEKNMQNLKRKLAYLMGQENDINVEISSAESQPWKRRKKEVEVWLRDVQRLKDDVQILEKAVVGAGKVLSCSVLGKPILKKIQEVQELQERGRVFNGLLVDELPIGRLLIPPTKDFVDSVEARNKENVWQCLMNEDVRKIGVYGMGGIGKTTIMKHIHNLLLQETGNFDSVFWVTVSKAFNTTTLQRDIGKVLKLSLLDGEDESRRASQLYAVLSRRKRYVLILDDLWEAFSLESVGIPEPTRSNGCKLVLTTRSLEVCRRMDCKAVKVEFLTEQEALTLFLSVAVGHDTMLAPEVVEIATEIAKKCPRLPLAIVTVARSVKGLNGKHEWRNALNEMISLTKGADDGGSGVIQQLKFSYSRLENKVLQDCFLYCCLYPKDHDIPVKELIEYWIAEGFIADLNSVEAKFDKGDAILRKLTSTSLVKFTDDYQDCVRVPDFIRDMALRITQSSPRFMVKSGVGFLSVPYEEWSEDLERISLMYNYTCELPKTPPNCPWLTTLLLRENRLSTIPESFFTYIRRLEVLDLSGNMIKSLPESISNLENLHALILAECNDLVYVPSLEKMKALKVLKLTHSRIEKAPKGIEELVNLRELDLSYNLRLDMFPGSKLRRLTKLQSLQFVGTKVEVSAEDLLCLRQLKVVAVHLHNIPELTRYVTSQRVQGLEKYCLAVGECPNFPLSDEEKNVRIDIRSKPYRSGVDQLVLPNDITSLELLGFHDLSSLLTIPGLKDARHLRRFDVKDCDGLESIFSSSSFSEDGLIFLRTIQSFDLSHLPSFRVLFDGTAPRHNISFYLTRLNFERCDSVKNIFPAQLLQNFPNLGVLRVVSCENVEDIIAGEEEMTDSNTITLPSLRELRLSLLPRLKSIYTGIMVCKSVELIRVCGCPMVRRLPLSLHMDNEQATAPPALQYILGEEEWWESLGWDDPLAKTLLEPFYQRQLLLKMVFKLYFLDDKSKRKAMETVSLIDGIESIAIDMKGKKLSMTGDIDPVTVAATLRNSGVARILHQ